MEVGGENEGCVKPETRNPKPETRNPKPVPMKAYRVSVNLKLGLIVFAVLIAVASLWYTNRFVDRLREREQSTIELWTKAYEQFNKAQAQALNPYSAELAALEDFLAGLQAQGDADVQVAAARPVAAEEVEAFRRAVAWAQGMPPASELNFFTDAFIVLNRFRIPAIITTASPQLPFATWRNVPVDSALSGLTAEDSLRAARRLGRLQREMDATYAPIPLDITLPGVSDPQLRQLVHYGESDLVRELRVFPYVQLLFVGLFILVGYLGFSYVRRSEQSSLWVGMAKEAAHQLGTPISSLMGWTELLQSGVLEEEQEAEALREVESDVRRLRRVANRFGDIGSQPKLEVMPLAPVIKATADYMRRRIPQGRGRVALDVDVPPDLRAPLNAELFEWVVENLIKNALDALEGDEGRIEVTARRDGERLHIDVRDTGKGIDRRQWKNVFRPGYSTKRRGWGLGLSLARRIVEDYHGGALLLAQSRLGHGTTFRIELPAA